MKVDIQEIEKTYEELCDNNVSLRDLHLIEGMIPKVNMSDNVFDFTSSKFLIAYYLTVIKEQEQYIEELKRDNKRLNTQNIELQQALAPIFKRAFNL